jgi:C1A family cysteine protease
MLKKLTGNGWMLDLPDERDHHFVAHPEYLCRLPVKIDLRPKCPSVFDQGERIGSCTANAVCNAFRFNLMKQGNTDPFLPSRLFIHYNARVMIGTQRQNHGAHIRDAIKSIAHQGVCHEASWPYITKKYALKPPRKTYLEALKHQAIAYYRLQQNLLHMKACLAGGYPFVFGITIYDQFESARVAKSGTLQMPRKKEGRIGGHSVLAVGYDDQRQRFTVMNSYGEKWGQKGYFTVPYEYLSESSLAADFWMLREVEI